MAKISVGTDCGNSPKMQFLKEFNIAFAKGDVDFLINNVAPDITWDIVGDKVIAGKEEYAKAMHEMKPYTPDELIIDKIITHGKFGAVNGVMKMNDGKSYAFSDFYEFKSHTSKLLKSMTSYVIKV